MNTQEQVRYPSDEEIDARIMTGNYDDGPMATARMRAAIDIDRESRAYVEDYALPCDVRVAPATMFRSGVRLSTMLKGIEARLHWEGRPFKMATAGQTTVGPAKSAVNGEAVAWEYRLHFLQNGGGTTEWAKCSEHYVMPDGHEDFVRFEKRALGVIQPAGQRVPPDIIATAKALWSALHPGSSNECKAHTILEWLEEQNEGNAP